MKKILFAAMLASGFAYANSVAVVDLGKVFRNLPEYEKFEADFTKETSLAQSKLNNKKLQLDAKVQELETNKDTLSEQKLQKIRREIAGLQRELKYMEADLRDDLAMKEQEQRNNLVNLAMMAVKNYAKKEKIDIVLGAEYAVYADSTKDVTDAIVKTVTQKDEHKDVKEKDVKETKTAKK